MMGRKLYSEELIPLRTANFKLAFLGMDKIGVSPMRWAEHPMAVNHPDAFPSQYD